MKQQKEKLNDAITERVKRNLVKQADDAWKDIKKTENPKRPYGHTK